MVVIYSRSLPLKGSGQIGHEHKPMVECHDFQRSNFEHNDNISYTARNAKSLVRRDVSRNTKGRRLLLAHNHSKHKL